MLSWSNNYNNKLYDNEYIGKYGLFQNALKIKLASNQMQNSSWKQAICEQK